MDSAVIQGAVTTAMIASMAQISTNYNNGTGNGTDSSIQGESHGRLRRCSYKDFSNSKPKTFYGNGGVISLTRCFDKTESVFEIYACPEESKV